MPHGKRLFLASLLSLAAMAATMAAEPERQFSDFESQHVRVKTPGLFTQSNKFVIEFDKLARSDWHFPIPAAKVISDYGKGRGRRSHSGIDMKRTSRDTIYAAFRGTVRMAKPYSGYGNVIVVRHVNGLETVYSHNSKNLVKPGDKVRAGDPIAITGRTGRATTEHLHFEVRINGEHINPHIIFNMKERTLRRHRVECVKQKNGISVKPVPAKKENAKGDPSLSLQ